MCDKSMEMPEGSSFSHDQTEQWASMKMIWLTSYGFEVPRYCLNTYVSDNASDVLNEWL